MKETLRNNQGVTLVELLIVIVILGIIAAIAVPAVGNIVENAERDAVVGEAAAVRDAAQIYCASNATAEQCSDQGEEGTTVGAIGSDGVSGAAILTSEDEIDNVDAEDLEDLDDYLDGFNGDYVAIRVDGAWHVAIVTDDDDYAYAGNPSTHSDRDYVLTDDEEETTQFANGEDGEADFYDALLKELEWNETE